MEKQTWVYIKSEPRLWTVGFYRPDGKWEPESDHSTPEEAARQVNFLCGGSLPSLEAQRDALKERVAELEEGLTYIANTTSKSINPSDRLTAMIEMIGAARALLEKGVAE